MGRWWGKDKKGVTDGSGYKRLNPEVCPKTGTLGGFRCKVRNIFVNLQITICEKLRSEISSVSFGFWTHLFTRQPYRLGGQNLLRIFPNRTAGLGQRAVFNELQEIKSFRNRIAHHEAICFDENGNIDMARTQDKYALILKYIYFLGYQSSHLFYGIDILPDATIAKIEALK